jgi:hypothetical protein
VLGRFATPGRISGGLHHLGVDRIPDVIVGNVELHGAAVTVVARKIVDAALRILDQGLGDQPKGRGPVAQKAFERTAAAHWLRLIPWASAIIAAWAWTSGETRNISLPEYGFCGAQPSFSQVER